MTSPPPPGDWSWKAKDGAAGRLLYEPGNWGDLLKASWIAAVLGGLLDAFGPGQARALDVFAGAPDYPLSAASAARARRVGAGDFVAALAPHLERGRWPGSAALMAEIIASARARKGSPPDPEPAVAVFDADVERRLALAADGRFGMLEHHDGYDALAGAFDLGPAGLALVDPYDLLADWRRALPALAARGRTATALVYVHNRSGRGREALREYRAFRAALAEARAGAPLLVGRIPADPFLPTAWHEMIWLPGERAREAPGLEAGTRKLLELATWRWDEASRRAACLEE